MPLRRFSPDNRRRITTGWALGVTVLLLLSLGQQRLQNNATERLAKESKRLTIANTRHIAEQQASRVASCRQTYRAFKKVFEPFLPPGPEPGEKPTPQQKRVQQFEDSIDGFILDCDQQTKPKKPKR